MDLYAVLCLEPGASDADIKRAYRRLARRYHPGINPGDRAAEALFHRITEAYETLVDPARREKYDSGGHGPAPGGETESFEFAGFDFTVAVQGAQAATFTELFADVLHPVSPADAGKPEAGADLHAALAVSFAEARTTCFVDLDKKLMEQAVPWVPYLWNSVIVITNPSVTKYEFDQFSTEMSITEIAVSNKETLS